MICSFDTRLAERVGVAAAIMLNNIINAIILRDDDKYPSWDISQDDFYYIHRFMSKKQADDALKKLIKNDYIYTSGFNDGRISIQATRLYL